jgi:hypothetical protein
VAGADADGWTALHFAAEHCQPAVVQQLLNAQAPVGAATVLGLTALHVSADRGHLGVVQLLLDAQADVNIQSTAAAGSRTPLSCAAAGGHMQVVQRLLTAPQLNTEAMASAAREASAAGHAELTIVVLKALISRDRSAAAGALGGQQALAADVLRLWQLSADAVRQQEARWPALQQLLLNIAFSHQHLQASAGDIITGAVSAAVQAVAPQMGVTSLWRSLAWSFSRGFCVAARKSVTVAAAVLVAIATAAAATVVAFVRYGYCGREPTHDLATTRGFLAATVVLLAQWLHREQLIVLPLPLQVLFALLEFLLGLLWFGVLLLRTLVGVPAGAIWISRELAALVKEMQH